MTAYTASQLTAMSTALNQANQSGATPAQIMAALNIYYSVQTSVRGYATLALAVINNTGAGTVANTEVSNAIGASNFTTLFKANLALGLANADIATINSNGGNVPTLAEVANDHAGVFANFNNSIGITQTLDLSGTAPVITRLWTRPTSPPFRISTDRRLPLRRRLRRCRR